jgi:predicted transglutaminase-like cysteine proteinase
MIKFVLIGAAYIASLLGPQTKISFYPVPAAYIHAIDKISFDSPALAPMAYTRFCLTYSDDCKVRRMSFRRPHDVALTEKTWTDLVTVNRQVNQAIAPQAKYGNILEAAWTLSPARGDCADFATTKRHELLARGWPSRSLLLAEVRTAWGEHHLVLVARLRGVDLVLDNLSPNIRRWSAAPYQWVRAQSPSLPDFWSTIAPAADIRLSEARAPGQVARL